MPKQLKIIALNVIRSGKSDFICETREIKNEKMKKIILFKLFNLFLLFVLVILHYNITY